MPISPSEVRASENRYKVSGCLCLAFVNSVNNYRVSESPDRIKSYGDLLAWGEDAGVLNPSEVKSLSQLARGQAESAAEAFALCLRFRLALYQIFSSIAHGLPVPNKALETLNRVVGSGLAALRLSQSEDAFSWTWQIREEALDVPLWPIAQSAADLLTSAELQRLRQCGGRDCTWLFLDRSKNKSRRWCEMEVCGNRAKSRRHYARLKSHDND